MKAIFTVSAESAGAVKAAKTTALKSALRRDSMFPLLVRVLFQALAAPRVLQKLPFRDRLSSSGLWDRASGRGRAGTGDPGPAIGRASSLSPEGDGYRPTRIIIIIGASRHAGQSGAATVRRTNNETHKKKKPKKKKKKK